MLPDTIYPDGCKHNIGHISVVQSSQDLLSGHARSSDAHCGNISTTGMTHGPEAVDMVYIFCNGDHRPDALTTAYGRARLVENQTLTVACAYIRDRRWP